MNLNDVKFKTGKPSVGEFIMLHRWAMNGSPEAALSFIVKRVEGIADVKQFVLTLMDLDHDAFGEFITKCVANIPTPDGAFIYPDGTRGTVPLQERDADPAISTKLEKMWGSE